MNAIRQKINQYTNDYFIAVLFAMFMVIFAMAVGRSSLVYVPFVLIVLLGFLSQGSIGRAANIGIFLVSSCLFTFVTQLPTFFLKHQILLIPVRLVTFCMHAVPSLIGLSLPLFCLGMFYRWILDNREGDWSQRAQMIGLMAAHHASVGILVILGFPILADPLVPLSIGALGWFCADMDAEDHFSYLAATLPTFVLFSMGGLFASSHPWSIAELVLCGISYFAPTLLAYRGGIYLRNRGVFVPEIETGAVS